MTLEIRRLEAVHRGSVLEIARGLPEWINAEGLAQIERDLKEEAGWVALQEDRAVGWVQWASLGDGACEMTWIGVKRTAHRRGVGAALVARLVDDLRRRGVRHLTVSTVAESMEYEPYARTRAFYRAVGFVQDRVDRGFFKHPQGDYDRLLLRLDP